MGSATADAVDALQPQLCPLFCSLLAPKGTKKAVQAGATGGKASKVVVPGPLAQLPAASQVNAKTPYICHLVGQ